MHLSTRELAALTGMSRNSIAAGLDQLYLRSAIILRWGTPTRPNRIYVCLWQGETLAFKAQPVLPAGGSKFEPPPAQYSPQVAQNLSHHSTEKQGCLYAQAGAPVGFDFDIDRNDRSDARGAGPMLKILNARPKDADPIQLHQAGQMLHEAMKRRGARVAKPPDDVVTAQFLASGPWPELQRLLLHIMQSSGTRIHHYSYFVAAALERCHGILPTELHAAREQLRPQLIKQTAQPLPAPPPQKPPTEEEYRQNERHALRAEGLSDAQIERYYELWEQSPPANGADVDRLITYAKATA